jgi:hypothetical protein
VTGFVVASTIIRAFKRVEGTSNQPRTPAWFNTVLENALKATSAREGRQRGTVGETPGSYRPTWMRAPNPPATQSLVRQSPEPVDVDRIGKGAIPLTLATAPEGGREAPANIPPKTNRSTPPAVEVCGRCGSDGVVNGAVPATWCDCQRGRQKRRTHPYYVDRLIRSGWRADAIATAVQPRPPQRETGPLCGVSATERAR